VCLLITESFETVELNPALPQGLAPIQSRTGDHRPPQALYKEGQTPPPSNQGCSRSQRPDDALETPNLKEKLQAVKQKLMTVAFSGPL